MFKNNKDWAISSEAPKYSLEYMENVQRSRAYHPVDPKWEEMGNHLQIGG